MNFSTLMKVLAVAAANKSANNTLTGVPIKFVPTSIAINASNGSIDTTVRESMVIDTNNATTAQNKTLASEPTTVNKASIIIDTKKITPSENKPVAIGTEKTESDDSMVIDPKHVTRNESTALVVWHGSDDNSEANHIDDEHKKQPTKVRLDLERVLKRMEDVTREKLHIVYLKIADFNKFNYEKNLEIQYLSYKTEKKQQIIEQSQQLKEEISKSYQKLLNYVRTMEKYRAKLTIWNSYQMEINPFHNQNPSEYEFWPQPKKVPELWYLIFNLETIMLQLYTPKPAIVSHFDEDEKIIRMMHAPMVQMIPRGFIPMPKKEKSLNNENDFAINVVHLNKQETVNPNGDVEQAVFSNDDYEQQILTFYIFKYFEYQTGDLARCVDYLSERLERLKGVSPPKSDFEIKQKEEELAAKLAELQFSVRQMELYRTTPELVNAYNAETNAHKLLPNSMLITKLTGRKNKRVIVNPIGSITSELVGQSANQVAEKKVNELTTSSADQPREIINTPLEWDKNWLWDF